MIPGVTIIVCCYNSADRLPETIKHLAQQQVSASIEWEIILVDNASTDNTAAIGASEWKKHDVQNIPFRILRQSKPGLANAKKMGIEAAQYEYLIFCDDDNWLNDNYVSRAFSILNADIEIGVLGGMGIAVSEQPAIFNQQQINKLTANGPQPWAQTGHWVYGAGSVYRKSILLDLMSKGWQQITTGRIGASMISCEDVEFCFMIYLSGYKIMSDDQLIFKHFVSLKKQNNRFRIKMAWGLSYSYFFMYSYIVILNKEKAPLHDIIKALFVKHAKALIKQAIGLAIKKLKGKTNHILEDEITIQEHYGMVMSIIKNRKKVLKHNQHLLAFLQNNNILVNA